MLMKHLRGITAGLVLAIAGMMFVSSASSQIDVRVHSGHRVRHHVVHHPRARVHVRLNVSNHRRHVLRHDDRRGPEHHPEGPASR